MQLLTGVAQVARLIPERERRRAGADLEAVDRRELPDDLVGQPIGEVAAVRIRSEILQRQNGDRRRVGVRPERDESPRPRRPAASRRRSGPAARAPAVPSGRPCAAPAGSRTAPRSRRTRRRAPPRSRIVRAAMAQSRVQSPSRRRRAWSGTGHRATRAGPRRARRGPPRASVPRPDTVPWRADTGGRRGCRCPTGASRVAPRRPRAPRTAACPPPPPTLRASSSSPPPKSVSSRRPSRSRITLWVFTSRWSRPARCTAASASPSSTAIRTTRSSVERTVLAQFVLERAAVDELHPDADAAVDPLGSVDRDDVGVADAREQTPFLDDGGRGRRSIRAGEGS